MKALTILILTSIFCCFVPLEAFSTQLKANGSIPVKLDSIIGYTYTSNTDSVLNSKTIYQYSADSLEVCSNSYKYVKESQTWINSYVDTFLYDNQKRKTKQIEYSWDKNANRWMPGTNGEFSYVDNLVTTIVSTYNVEQMKWVRNIKNLSRYDVKSGKPLIVENYIWDPIISQFIGTGKEVTVYNETNEKIRDTVYTWNSDINDWKGGYNVHYYNQNGEDTLLISYTWKAAGSTWEPSSKTHFNRYTKGINLFSENLTLNWNQSASRWDSASTNVGYIYMFTMETESYLYVTKMPAGTKEWSQFSKSELSYNEQGRIDSVMLYKYNNNTSSWDKSSNISLEFTESGKVTNSIFYGNYDVTTQLYMTGSKDIYLYDETGETIKEESYSWNGNEQKWVGKSKREYRIGNPSGLNLYVWDYENNTWLGAYSYDTYKREDEKTRITNYNTWDSNTKSWNFSSRHFYYYSEFKAPVDPTGNTSISDTPSQISVFPNPTTGFVQFTGNDIDRVDVVSSTGTLLKSVTKPQNLDIASFPTGLYYLLVTAKNGEKQCLKVIKK